MNSALIPAVRRHRNATARSPRAKPDPRAAALRRFAVSITVLTIVGHTLLGFEQAYATPVVAVLTAGLAELTLETIEAKEQRRPARYAGGPMRMIDFLLPAHITGLACAMLLYANSELGPVIFAVIVAIASKYVIRVRVKGRARHVLNPSNAGIAATLVLFHWVGIAPPYQFTEWVRGPLDWIIPGAILLAGTMLNAQLTGKMPLILAWVGAFAAQAVVRTTIEHTNTVTALLVMTGTAFVLFTNYMITDPGTTPVRPWRQAAFGAATAATYGLLVYVHVAFGLFFALSLVCCVRGAALAMTPLWRRLTSAWPVARAALRAVRPAPAVPDAQAATPTVELEPPIPQVKQADPYTARQLLDIAATLLDAATEHLDAAADDLGVRHTHGRRPDSAPVAGERPSDGAARSRASRNEEWT
jgi:enediyne biosynthesis protein E5